MPFTDPYKIIVGENGSGKTTVLNCLYYTLSRRFDMLSEIKFESIKIEFGNGNTLEFVKHEVDAFIEKRAGFQDTQFYRLLSQNVKPKDVNYFRTVIYSSDSEVKRAEKIVSRMKSIGFNFKAPSSYIYQNVARLVHEYMSIDFAHKIEVLDSVGKETIFYFPTYRRVESAIVSWDNITERLRERYPFIDKEDITDALNNELIQFGMDDVNRNILQLTREIKKRTMEGFSSIMGSMLSQLSRNDDGQRNYQFEEIKIKIILDRLGDKVKTEDKSSIIKYSTSKNLNNKNLNYLIGKLIKLYEDQEEFDIAIKKFRDTCNRYLNEKKFVYNESTIDLYIEQTYSHSRLGLECLSSGEKQIVSLFSKIYLDVDHTFVMLLDEPELSLSLDWQEQLLPDIIASEKCSFLLTVTHSPFIYNNSMKPYAASLADFIKINEDDNA